VNRVVGKPGDHVTHVNGLWKVNGEEPEARYAPLGRLLATGDLDVTLGPREYAIFTTVDRRVYGRPDLDVLASGIVTRHLSIVGYDDILGHVILRLRPLSRFGSLG
jgi:hypothetical protein